MIKYSGIYESSTPPTSTKALWVDGGVLKIYKNGSWRPVDDPKSKLTIDSILKAGSTNPVENKAIYNRFIGVDKDIEVNKNNIADLTRRTDEIDGIAKGTEALAKINESRINYVSATAFGTDDRSKNNETKINDLIGNLADVKNTADGNKHDIESLTDRTIKPLESKVSQLQELNVVYPNNIRNLTTESTVAEVKEAFIPAIGGTADRVNTPHVGYLIKGATHRDSPEDAWESDPDSIIISVDIIKTDNKDYHKFIYVDNNTAIISVTVDLVNYRLIDKSTLANIEANSKVGTLRDLYISAGAKYNEATGFYELNGLTDITEEEMRTIWQEDLSGWYRKGRTNLTRNIAYKGTDGGYSGGQRMSNICNGNTNLEVFNFGSDFYASYSFVAFSGCTKLREVLPQYKIVPYTASLGYNLFNNCPALQEVRFDMRYVTSGNVLFSESPLLSKESVLSIITTMGSVPKENPFTITLHPTAYARLKDDADIVVALEAKGGIVVLISA